MKAKHPPITDMFSEFHRVGDYCLTKNSTLIGAVEIDGVDPDGLTEADFMALAKISRSVCSSLGESVKSVTQYYIHMDNAEIRLKDRERETSHYLSKRRERFLSKKKLSATRIVHFFEIKPDDNLTKLSPLDFARHCALAIKKGPSRQVLKRYLSTQQNIVACAQDLKRQKEELDDALEEVKARWDTVSGCHPLRANQLWAYLRFLASMDPGELYDALDDSVPDSQWDLHLADADIEQVRVDGADMLKFYGVQNTYARILSVTGLSQEDEIIEPGMWSAKKYSPARRQGNYVIMCRYLPLSKREQKKMFSDKKNALERKNLKLSDILKGTHENLTRKEKRRQMKRSIREKLESIEDAEGLEERWGRLQAAVMVFNTSARALKKQFKALRKSMRLSELSTVVETIDLPFCYRSIMPGGAGWSLRNIDVNSTQLGAVSLMHRAHEGQITVADLGGEEAQYVLYSADGTPFHYSPYVGGLSIVIIVGPSRSGKTFLLNSFASHFLKYGGLYRGAGIDAGPEPLAQSFGDDGAIFRIDMDHDSRGFNLFTSAKGPNDRMFFSHMRSMIMQMLKDNDDESLQKFGPGEQEEFDKAVAEVLRLPRHLQSLTSLAAKCGNSLKQKFSRWCGDGPYAALFDQVDDAMGAIDKPLAVFNMEGIKNHKVLLPMTMNEIFYRVTRMFEDKNQIGVPKFLEMDEAHAMLKLPHVPDYIIQSARTWGKCLGGLGLCSQFPHEFEKVPEWPALRASATTFWFTANQAMDAEQYRRIFDLTEGECDAIKKLRPKREAYIIQRELGISKTVIMEVEPEQYVVNTSKPSERVLRDNLIRTHGFEKGVAETIKALNLKERAA
jgi:type IV secretion system protein VirB4